MVLVQVIETQRYFLDPSSPASSHQAFPCKPDWREKGPLTGDKLYLMHHALEFKSPYIDDGAKMEIIIPGYRDDKDANSVKP